MFNQQPIVTARRLNIADDIEEARQLVHPTKHQVIELGDICRRTCYL